MLQQLFCPVLTARFCHVMPSVVLSCAGFHNVLPAGTVSPVASRLLCDAVNIFCFACRSYARPTQCVLITGAVAVLPVGS